MSTESVLILMDTLETFVKVSVFLAIRCFIYHSHIETYVNLIMFIENVVGL